MSTKGADSSHDRRCDKVRSKCARATSTASWKNPRENKETKAHKEDPSWISALPPFRPGTARGGNYIKVDVGYARAAPSVRGIINSQRRAVTKVKACSLVSRSVSGRADSSSPSSFRHPRHFAPLFFFHGSHPSHSKNPRIDSSAIIHEPQPSSVSITAHLLLFYLRQRTSEVSERYFSPFFSLFSAS